VQAGCPAAAVEPREPELGGELGGELVFVTGELPVDLVVAVTLVSADQPGRVVLRQFSSPKCGKCEATIACRPTAHRPR